MEEQRNQEVFLKYRKVLFQDKFPVGEFECQKANIHLHDINYIVTNLDNFIEVFQSSLTENQIIAKLCELIVGFGLVNISDGQEKDYQSDDFPCTAEYAESSFESLKVILSRVKDLKNSDGRQIISNVLILCATHSKKYVWSSENSVILGTEFLSQLLVLSDYEDLSSLLCGDDFHPTIFKGVLKKLRPSLMKDTWLQNPSSCHIFSWFLHHVKHPYLADYLSDIFPPPCMFMSDHQICHRVLAIQCFHHILDNVPPTLIKLDGKEDVIYNLLSPYIHSAEEDVLAVLSPCLLKLPSIKSEKMTMICWSHYDEVLNQLLFRAEMEFKKKSKLLYLSHIHSFIQITPPFKHLKRLLKVMEESLTKDIYTECQIISLRILKDVIISCWPSMEIHCFEILKPVAILLCKLEETNYQTNIEDVQEIYDLCEDCLTHLKYACKKEFQNIASKYVEEGDMPGTKIFKSVLCKD